MTNLLVGNVVALIASLIMVYTGIIKSKKKILYFQTIQIGLFVFSNLILGGISGAIINAISLVRNILSYNDKLHLKAKMLITVLSIIFIVKFNNLGFIGFLPLFSTIIYIWLMNIKNVRKFKVLIIFTMLLWLVYDIYIKSYTSAIFDAVTILFNIISIFDIEIKIGKI